MVGKRFCSLTVSNIALQTQLNWYISYKLDTVSFLFTYVYQVYTGRLITIHANVYTLGNQFVTTYSTQTTISNLERLLETGCYTVLTWLRTMISSIHKHEFYTKHKTYNPTYYCRLYGEWYTHLAMLYTLVLCGYRYQSCTHSFVVRYVYWNVSDSSLFAAPV